MGALNRFLVLMLVFLILTSLITLSIRPAEVQAAPKPSVPQFTVKFIDKSYDVPPTQTTDPFTGVTTTTPGYHVDDGLIEITIKNQPFTPETGSNNQLYYYVEAKGSFGGDNDWYNLVLGSYMDTGYVKPSDSEYTIANALGRYESGVKLDIRAKAVIGHLEMMFPLWGVVVESSSDWSKIQTITITHSASSLPPSQTITQPENPPTTSDNNQPDTWFVFNPFFLLGIGALVGGVVVAVVMVFTRRYLKTQAIMTFQIRAYTDLSQVNFIVLFQEKLKV